MFNIFCAQFLPISLAVLISGVVMAKDNYRLAMTGGKLSAEAAAKLEVELAENPDNTNVRTQLLGYYFPRKYRDEVAASKQQQHVLWLIQNAPKSDVLGLPYARIDAVLAPLGYSKAKDLWIEKLAGDPDDLKLRNNAAKFFLLHDRDLAEQSLAKARSLDKDNPQWPADLGQLHALNMNSRSAKARKQAAAKSLEYFEVAYELSTDRGRDPMLKSLAKAAWEAGEIEKAKKYAEAMLAMVGDNWNSGNNVHHGNVILGRIALADGDIEEAKKRLLASGETKGSPQLNSFGPNMTLAKELLEAGEKQVVLDYFDACKKFWKMGGDRLENWSQAINDGKVPGFGPSLSY